VRQSKSHLASSPPQTGQGSGFFACSTMFSDHSFANLQCFT
jgi:hypothetical protein